MGVREWGAVGGSWVCERGSNRGVEKIQNEELHDLFRSPNITCLMKSRTDGQGMWHVRCKREIPAGLWCRNVEEDVGVNACKIIVQTGWYCVGWRDISTEVNFGMHKMRRISY